MPRAALASTMSRNLQKGASAGELAAALAIAEAYLGLGRSVSERFTLEAGGAPARVLVAEDNPTNRS